MVDNKKEAHHRSALYWIEPEKIVVTPGLNARDLTTPDNVEHIRIIADSIKKNGFLESEPLEVTTANGIIELTAGHCRLAAVKLAKLEGHNTEFVPYVPESKGTDDAQRLINQRISNMGKPLTPLEEGFNVKRLLGLGLDIAAIAERTARSDTYIEQLLKLQAAPSDVKEMVAQGEVSAKTAVETMRTEGQAEGAEVLRETVAAARAAGKKKATPKDVQKRLQAKDETKRFRMVWKPKAGLLGVRIGQTEFALPPETWLDMADKIAAEARKLVAERSAPNEEPEPA